MKKIARLVVNHKLVTVIIFAVLTVIAVVCIPFVNINYNDTSYLPKDSSLKVGLQSMYSDFGEGGNATMMVSRVGVADMVDMNQDLEKISGVSNMMWIDDLFLSDIIPEGTLPGGQRNLSDVFGIPGDKLVVMVIDLLDMIMDIPIESRTSIDSMKSYIDTNKTVLNKNSGTEYTEKWPEYDKEYKQFYNTAIIMLGLFPEANSFDLTQIDMIASQIDGFYKRDQNNFGYALVQISFENSDYDKKTLTAIDEIQEFMEGKGYKISLVGNAAITHNSVSVMSSETTSAMVIAVLIVLAVLLLTTSSYWESILLLIPMGVSILINMGSNLIMPQISYMTNSIASVLQLALTMDYSIYLLNRFKQEKARGLSSNEAMAEAMAHGAKAISSASLTTIASFVALMFMSYGLGLDMGIVLAKGVVFSMVSVFFLLPVLTLYTEKLISKTAHKTFNLSFRKFSGKLLKHRVWMPVFLIALLAIGAVFQAQNLFTYGQEASMGGDGTPIATSRDEVEGIFGRQNQALVLLNYAMFDTDGDNSLDEIEKAAFNEREIQLSERLIQIPGIKSVQCWATIESAGASAILPDSYAAQFKGQDSSRVILFLDVPEEGVETTELVMQINSTIEEIYQDRIDLTGIRPYHIGNSAATLAIKTLVTKDYDIITYISLALVALIILIAFKSLLLPIILVVTIQGAIYVNMAVPYFQQEPIVFVGYMLVSAILLGATIDYAIVVTSHYMEHRQNMNKYNAMQHALADSARTLMTSGGILTFSGLALAMTTSSPATAVFGNAIFRGGILSFAFVITLLPQLLVIFDSAIRATTFRGKKLMMDNRLCSLAPDVVEKSITLKAPKKKRPSQLEREQEIIDAIIAGIESHNIEEPTTFKPGITIEKKEDIKDLTDFMEETVPLYEEDIPQKKKNYFPKEMDEFSPPETRKRIRKKIPESEPEIPEDDEE